MKAHLLIAVTLILPCVTFAKLAPAGEKLPRSTPEAQGIPSAAVLSLIEALDQIDSLNSFMLVRHGHVVAEGWWAPIPGRRAALALFAQQEFHLHGGGPGRG